MCLIKISYILKKMCIVVKVTFAKDVKVSLSVRIMYTYIILMVFPEHNLGYVTICMLARITLS